jgi:hypothetical protein
VLLNVSEYTVTRLELAEGITTGIEALWFHICDGLIIASETIASLGAFLFALVSVLALLKPTFFQSKSTF